MGSFICAGASLGAQRAGLPRSGGRAGVAGHPVQFEGASMNEV